MRKPRLLDLFCSAGGCSVGYAQAGFECVGVDIGLQPRYPYEFHQADALEYLDTADLSTFDVIHASPECQAYSSSRHFPNARPEDHPKLIKDVRGRLEKIGLPWVIENVVGSDLPDAIQLCGSMFGLPIQRHRWFASSHLIFVPGPCQHVSGFYNVIGGKIRGYGDYASAKFYDCADGRQRRREGYYTRDVGCKAMDIGWMTIAELCQAIPPAYTRYIGTQLLRMLGWETIAS